MGFFGLLGNLFGSKKKEKQPNYLTQLQPLIDQQSRIAQESYNTGNANLNKAEQNLDIPLDFYKTILNGDYDDILKLIDSSEITKQDDDNERLLAEFGVRGGNRASQLGNANFDRNATLNRIIQQYRGAAPAQITNIANAIAAIGGTRMGVSQNAYGTSISSIFGVEGINQQEKDRRAQLIASIIGSVAGAAGTIAGSR